MTSKERTPTSYLTDDWSGKPPGGDNASGVTETPDYEYGVPYRAPEVEHEDWGGQGSENPGGGFGHSSDCKDTGTKSSAWGMDKDEIAQGFERGKSDGEGSVLGTRQPGGSFPASIPETNKWDRQQAYANEHSETGVYDGTGRAPSGHKVVGSRENLG